MTIDLGQDKGSSLGLDSLQLITLTPWAPIPAVNSALWKPHFPPWVLGKWLVLGEASLPLAVESLDSGYTDSSHGLRVLWVKSTFEDLLGTLTTGLSVGSGPGFPQLSGHSTCVGWDVGAAMARMHPLESVSPNPSCLKANLFASHGLRGQS